MGLPGLLILFSSACSNISTWNGDDAASQMLPQMAMEKMDFQRSYQMPCAQPKDCAMPLVCYKNACEIPPGMTGVPNDDTKKLSFHTGGIKHSLNVEIASTDYTRQMGMMKRRYAAPGWGMLFIFKNNMNRSFWMHETYIPLDIIFIRNDGTVVNMRENARPLDDYERYQSTQRAKYVLELPAGAVKQYGIQTSTVFDIAPFASVEAQ